MESENMEVRLEMERLVSSSSSSSSSAAAAAAVVVMYQCRICHEEEESISSTMESPCSCSGSLKFAHRDCIQRWCDEKGSTLCEICLQNFEPGYTVPEKKALIEVPVTIRGSLEVPRLNYDPPNNGLSSDGEADYAECSSAAERGVSYCRSVAVAFTVLLLLRHLIAVLSVGADQYAFTLVTVFLLRASGILLPFYVVLRIIKAIQQAQRQHQVLDGQSNRTEEMELHQHAIHIQA